MIYDLSLQAGGFITGIVLIVLSVPGLVKPGPVQNWLKRFPRSGIAGVVLGAWLSHPSVEYVVTLPGTYGYRWAFVAEVAITFVLMSVILHVSNSRRFNRYTGLFAGFLVMIYISIEAPISGMSMNPARTLGSAVSAATWTAIWIYFTAPPLGMLLAAEHYVRSRGAARVLCAKLHHENRERCIFLCNYSC